MRTKTPIYSVSTYQSIKLGSKQLELPSTGTLADSLLIGQLVHRRPSLICNSTLCHHWTLCTHDFAKLLRAIFTKYKKSELMLMRRTTASV